jgi:hypothetical protein
MATPDRTARLELVATLLLAFATVATAWAAFQSREWTGEQASSTAKATAARLAANRFAALANRQVQIDVATLIQWVDARQQHRPTLAAFYEARFRPEFRPAFDAWLATRPFTTASAPSTPFAMRQYRLSAAIEADRLEATAAGLANRASEANRRGDAYMLAVVLFASALFLGAMATRLDDRRLRVALLVLGCVVFAGALAWIATLPTQVLT